jgi:glycosyltransferase involved in cell wall biosynthesis
MVRGGRVIHAISRLMPLARNRGNAKRRHATLSCRKPPGILIVQAGIPHYRVPFFSALYRELLEDGWSLGVAYSWLDDGVDAGHPWMVHVPKHSLPMGAYWQSFGLLANDYDLVIYEHAARALSTWVSLILRRQTGRPVAFWGHGRNMGSSSGLVERAKAATLSLPDWWFAYTEEAAGYLADRGFPADRISIVNNAVDTLGFSQQVAQVDDVRLDTLTQEPPPGRPTKIALYCGRLIRDRKRLDVLFEVAGLVAHEISEFVLLVVGDGVDRPFVEEAAMSNVSIRYLGALYGERKAEAFALADVFVHPGALGLAVLDAFSAGLPVLTTENPCHGPEFAYLKDGVNGFVAPNTRELARLTGALLQDPDQLRALSAGALITAKEYTLERMVSSYATGIRDWWRRQSD